MRHRTARNRLLHPATAAVSVITAQIARERRPLTRLVALMGDSTFSWCPDDQLEPLDSSEASRERLRAFQGYGAKQRVGSVTHLQVARALQELSALERGGADAAVPWPQGSPSSGDEGPDREPDGADTGGAFSFPPAIFSVTRERLSRTAGAARRRLRVRWAQGGPRRGRRRPGFGARRSPP